MSQNHSSRKIDDALTALVDSFLPLPSSKDKTHEEKVRQGVRLAKSILDSRSKTPAVVSDVNHASDLIKKTLLRQNDSPEQALRFTNLYSRLLTQTVLSQRWAMLYFLHQLTNSEPTRYAPDGSAPQWQQIRKPRDVRQSLAAPDRAPRGEEVDDDGDEDADGQLSEAFSSNGLPRLPTREGGQRDRSEHPSTNAGDRQSVRDSSGKATPNLEPPDGSKPSEAVLLRDLPFALQGLSSANFPFTPTGSLTLPANLPPSTVSILHALAEPSLLYRGLSAYGQASGGDLIHQSLRAAVGAELRSYLGLVATLEGEIRRALTMLDSNDPGSGFNKAGVTLRRCIIWTREATKGLRLMSMIVEESKSKRGGQLISLIHGFSSSHGDPFVGAFAERLLAHVTRPFYDMLRQWIYDGELSDPHQEFFVTEQPPVEPEAQGDGRGRGGATSVWDDKYKLDDGMIPSIMTEDFAKKVFLIGKSLNFIRHGCGDSAWVDAYSKDASKELRYGDTATLEASIDEAYRTTMARLMHLMEDKFKLVEHLTALKKYLLLGQGDFIALLMESLASNLDRPANTLFRHSLTAQLEHAIRGSNAQYDSPDVLRRLDARMLMQGHGEIGWEIFTLEYKIDAPIDVIVTPEGSREYLKVFNFLWRVKRVEFALGSTWRRCMTGARGVLAAVDDKVGKDWKIARCCVAEMIHFVTQLQYYILFEVIESSWDELQLAIAKPGATLDDLIGAHAKYLQAITHKGLLGQARASSTGRKEDSFLAQLHEILKIMLAYKDAVDGLYSFSVAEFTRRQEFGAKIEARTAQGRWGVTEADEDELRSPSPAAMRGSRGHGSSLGTPFAKHPAGTEDEMLPSLGQRLLQLSTDFRAKLNVLLGDLAYQPDVDMRFLGVVMNFNDVYQPVRRKSRKDVLREKERDRKTTPKGASGLGSGEHHER